ncbi:MAG: cyclase family protein [Synergistaceae bacterium]|jgi:kynurenine formamidase|nr:cyclase family protein [Synergistaceae bacterium]
MRESYIKMFENLKASARIVDLSYTLEEGMPVWPTQARYGGTLYESYDYGDEGLHSRIVMSEHTGTHIDAPKHFMRGGCPIDEMPVSAIMGRGVKIDAMSTPEKGLFSLEEIRHFEALNGEIKPGDIVMLRFGWDEKYGLQPNCAGYLRDWPGLDQRAAEYLAGRNVAAVGCDTLSLDAYGLSGSPCHHTLLGKNIPIIENLCALSLIPVFTYLIGLPNKFKGGSGSPIRIVAFSEEFNSAAE